MNRCLIIPGICCGLAFSFLVVSFSQSADQTEPRIQTALDRLAYIPHANDLVPATPKQRDRALLDRAAAEALVLQQVITPWRLATSHRHIFSRAAPRPTTFESTFDLAETTEAGAVFCGIAKSKRGKQSEQLPFVMDRTSGAIFVLVDEKWLALEKWRERFAPNQNLLREHSQDNR